MLAGRTMVGFVVAAMLGAACSGGAASQSDSVTAPKPLRSGVRRPVARPNRRRPVAKPPISRGAIAQTPATLPARRPPVKRPSPDPERIQVAVDTMNAAFRRSVADGIETAVTANYWVAAGVYSAAQCRAFEQARSDDNHIADQMAIVSGSVIPEPGWVDPVVGRRPGGTIYRLQVAIARTNVYTGTHTQTVETTHVVLPGNGTVGFMLRC